MARPRSYLAELALEYWLEQADVPRGTLRLDVLGRMSHSHVRPITESDPVAIEPKGDK